MSDNQLNNTIAPARVKRKRRGFLGCLGKLLLNLFLLLLLALAAGIISFFVFPPFGNESVARVLLVGADEPETPGGARRSDTIMLCAARLNGSGTTLLSIPRDARVRIAHHRGYDKINAAFAYGGVQLLQTTLADPNLLEADLPHYLVVDSSTTQAVIDALGGIEVNVTRDMDYDDAWANLHIHLRAGTQQLNGKQVVGFLRWRKNNNGHGSSTDFERTERQRALLIGISKKLHEWQGIMRLPMLYLAFRSHTKTDLSLRQLILLSWAARQTQSAVVPGAMRTIGGVSYVLCDWREGREIWQHATQ